MTDYTALIARLRAMADDEKLSIGQAWNALNEAADALEAAEKVIVDVDKWVDDLYPYSDHGTAPAPVFQACKAWRDKYVSGT